MPILNTVVFDWLHTLFQEGALSVEMFLMYNAVEAIVDLMGKPPPRQCACCSRPCIGSVCRVCGSGPLCPTCRRYHEWRCEAGWKLDAGIVEEHPRGSCPRRRCQGQCHLLTESRRTGCLVICGEPCDRASGHSGDCQCEGRHAYMYETDTDWAADC